jgi:midasin
VLGGWTTNLTTKQNSQLLVFLFRAARKSTRTSRSQPETILLAHGLYFSVLSAFLRRPSLSNGPLAFINRENATSLPVQHLHVILLAYWRLINVSPHLPLEFCWPIEPLAALCAAPHPNPGVLWLALNCYAIHMGLNEPGRVQLEEKLLGKDVITSIYSPFDETLEGRVLPYIEMRRANNYLMVIPENYASMFTAERCIDECSLR